MDTVSSLDRVALMLGWEAIMYWKGRTCLQGRS